WRSHRAVEAAYDSANRGALGLLGSEELAWRGGRVTLRKVLFWLHLTAGSVAGVVILVMSVTGVLLVVQRPLIAWVDRDFRSHPPSPAASRMPLGTLLAKAASDQSAAPSAVSVYADPRFPVEVSFGRERTVYFDAFTGAELGTGSQRTRAFFQAVE